MVVVVDGLTVRFGVLIVGLEAGSSNASCSCRLICMCFQRHMNLWCRSTTLLPVSLDATVIGRHMNLWCLTDTESCRSTALLPVSLDVQHA